MAPRGMANPLQGAKNLRRPVPCPLVLQNYSRSQIKNKIVHAKRNVERDAERDAQKNELIQAYLP